MTHTMGRAKWKNEEIALLKALVGNGLSVKEIQQKLPQYNTDQIKNKMINEGLKPARTKRAEGALEEVDFTRG